MVVRYGPGEGQPGWGVTGNPRPVWSAAVPLSQPWSNQGAEVKKTCRQVSLPGEFRGIREEAEDLCWGSVILKDARTSYCSCESTRTRQCGTFN